MRLTDDEILVVTSYLVSTLKRKRFSVSTNRFGVITNIEKFGVRCCPSIVNSEEDGRHGFSYIVNEMNSYDSKDLGYYFKPRSNKDKPRVIKNFSINKYTHDNAIRIDIHNYKRVIEQFADDLNKDYFNVSRRINEDAEQEDGIELDVSSVEEVVDFKTMMLADYLDVNPFEISESDEYNCGYFIEELERTYRVFTDSEAQEEIEECVRNNVYDLSVDDLGINLEDYLDKDYCENYMKDWIANDTHDMSDDDLIDVLLEYQLISLDDGSHFKLRDGVDVNDDDFDAEDISNYEVQSSREELEDIYIDYRTNSDDLFWEYKEIFGGRDLEEDVEQYRRAHNYDYPSYIRVDSIINDLVDIADRGSELAWYSCSEDYLGEHEGESVYAYRMD